MPIITGLDIETTGLLKGNNEKNERIVEICMRLYDLETRKCRLSWSKRINPQRSINPAAQAVHGISLADLAGEPVWEDVAPTVVKLLEKTDIVVAHNGNAFDLIFVGLELLRVNLPVPEVTPFDTMLEGRWATANGKVPNLKELCFACDITYDPSKAHAAEYDVEVMMQSLWRGVDLGSFKLPEAA